MSYIAFDLDALHRAPAAARSAGVSEDTVIAGLARMWAWCWREKTATITAEQLRGHFASEVAPALVAFGFLEAQDGSWRVRGAERYLRIAEARSKGGKAASKNLKRGTAQSPASRRASREAAPAPAGKQPGSSPGTLPGLTPSTEHRAPKEETTAGPPDAARAALVEKLFASFQRLRGSKPAPLEADWAALRALRKRAHSAGLTDGEILLRWERGLRAEFKERCDTFRDLNSRFDALADRRLGEGPPRQDDEPLMLGPRPVRPGASHV